MISIRHLLAPIALLLLTGFQFAQAGPKVLILSPLEEINYSQATHCSKIGPIPPIATEARGSVTTPVVASGCDTGQIYIENLTKEFTNAGATVTVRRGALSSEKGNPKLTLDQITGYDVVAVMSVYQRPRKEDMQTIKKGVINKTSSAFLFFLDTCCSPYTDASTNLLDMLNTAANGVFVGTYDTEYRSKTSNPLNTTNPYAGDFITAGTTNFYGQAWRAFKVPADYVLFKSGTDISGSGITDQSKIPADLAYGALVPQNISPGACVFVTTDSSGFDVSLYSSNNSQKIGKGFIAATTSLGGWPDNNLVQRLFDDTNTSRITMAFELQTTATNGWRGDILGYEVKNYIIQKTPKWKASQRIKPHATRKIFTTDGTTAKPFNTSLSTSYKNDLINTATVSLPITVAANDLINYLRGDTSKEQGTAANLFRKRQHLIGPMFNSRAVVDYGQGFGWDKLPEAEGGGTVYIDYLNKRKSATHTLYVGTGDGMVHAIDTTTGDELFTYVPKGLRKQLKHFADPVYSNLYQIDAPVSLQDVYDKAKGEWRTVLVGTLGGTRKGVFALDVTNPKTFTANDVLWDFDETDAGFNDKVTGLGVMYEPPRISRLPDGRAVAIFGNGFATQADETATPRKERDPALYIVDFFKKSIIGKVVADYTSSITGLGGVTLVANNNGVGNAVEYVYAGDLYGYMRRFDLRGDPSTWKAHNVFLARTASDLQQPIISSPEVSIHPSGGYILYFGTGKYRALTNDETDTRQQSFYVIRDSLSGAPYKRDKLAKRTIAGSTNTTIDGESRELVKVTAPPFSWQENQGWYMDLQASGTSPAERATLSPEVIFGNVIFTTQTPIAKPCETGLSNRQYIFSAFSGMPMLKDDPKCLNCAGISTPSTSGKNIVLRPELILGLPIIDSRVPGFVVPPPPTDEYPYPGVILPHLQCPIGEPVTSHKSKAECAKMGIGSWFQLR